MRRSRFSEEQIIGILREHQAGATTGEVWRRTASRMRPFISGKRSTAAWTCRMRSGSEGWRMRIVDSRSCSPRPCSTMRR